MRTQADSLKTEQRLSKDPQVDSPGAGNHEWKTQADKWSQKSRGQDRWVEPLQRSTEMLRTETLKTEASAMALRKVANRLKDSRDSQLLTAWLDVGKGS